MTLAEIIRAQLATGRPLRVTRALLEALDASETDAAVMASLRATAREHATMMRDDLLYGTRTALCEALALPASTPGPAIVAAVVAIRETAKHDREERDEARRELSHRPTMIAHTAACRERDEERARANEWLAQKHDAERERDEAQRNANAWADERDVMRRARDEARVEVERLRQEADTVAVPEGGVPRERWLRVGPAVVVALRAEVERLTAERDDATARTIHSCHAGCQRPTCVLRRERDTLAAALAEVREAASVLLARLAVFHAGVAADEARALNTAFTALPADLAVERDRRVLEAAAEAAAAEFGPDVSGPWLSGWRDCVTWLRARAHGHQASAGGREEGRRA